MRRKVLGDGGRCTGWRRLCHAGLCLALALPALAAPQNSGAPPTRPAQVKGAPAVRLTSPTPPRPRHNSPALPDMPTLTPRQVQLEKDSGMPPPPEGRAHAEVIAPLSIYESCLTLNDALTLLERTADLASPEKVRRTDRLLRAVGAYVERVDRAYPTLPSYRWQAIASEKLTKISDWQTQAVTLKAPLKHITAISLQAHHGDVEIKYLAISDQNGTKWEFNQLILVLADQPRPEICFLPLSTHLAAVRIISRQMNPKSPRRARLFVDAGVCSVPEYAKQANYYLQLARNDLKLLKLNTAAASIRQAYELLQRYQKSRRL